MKILAINSNSISLESKIRFGEQSKSKKSLSHTEKRQLKGMIKTFLGMAYFVALVYSVFVLLT